MTVLFIESISNPLLKVADIPAPACIAYRFGDSLLMDGAFASHYLINPFGVREEKDCHLHQEVGEFPKGWNLQLAMQETRTM